MKATRSSLWFTLFLVVPLWAFDSHKPFDISADTLEYTESDQAITATGKVIVVQESSTLKADTLRYDRTGQRLFAQGNVFLEDKGATLLGNSLDYDLARQTGIMTRALGYQAPWIFNGKKWQKHIDYVTGDDIEFTSCDLVEPHYRVKSSRIHLYPDHHFWSWSNLAFVDKIPLFYSPFIYKSLAERNVVIRFQPGHDSTHGDFVKTITTMRFSPFVYDRFYYDHYTAQGNGYGNELNYNVPGRLEGSLFGYYIDPHGIPEIPAAPQNAQYNIRAYHWQRLSSALTLQSNVNLRKNISFNSQFFPQDTNQSVSDVTSSVALTHQKKHINQRLVMERLDAPDSGNTDPFAETHVQTATYPRYDFTFFQIPIWTPGKSSLQKGTTTPLVVTPQRFGPLLFNANATFGNTYQRLDDQYHPNAAGSFTLSESIRISRDWSFTPTLTPQLRWQDKFDAQPPPPVGSTIPVSTVGLFRGYQGRMGTANTLRWRPLSSLTLDNTYSLTARMEPNGMGLDRRPSDGGIETHHVNWFLFWRPSRRTMLRSFSGYDIRHIADEPLMVYRQRKWDPWTSELTYNPNQKSDYFFRYALGYYPFRSQLWEGTYRYRGLYRTLLETGMLYNKGQTGYVTWNNRIGVYLSPSWYIDATLHTLVPNANPKKALRGDMIGEEINVTRDLHCWQARFTYRNTPPFSTFYAFTIDIKLGLSAERQISNNDLESKYYPWRARTPL